MLMLEMIPLVCVVLEVFIPTLRGRGRGTSAEVGLTTLSITTIDRVEEPTRGTQGESDVQGMRLLPT